MLLKFSIFSVVVIVLGAASYVFVSNNFVEHRGQVVITDKDVTSASETAVSAANDDEEAADVESVTVQMESGDATTRLLGDLSTVTTASDGWGNTTETRVFRSHPRLRMVMVQTSANGFKRAFVYGHLGGVKTLTGSDADIALSSGADEIANKAEIFETKLDKSRRLTKVARSGSVLQPMDSSEIEINNPAPEVESLPSATKVSEKGKSAEGI